MKKIKDEPVHNAPKPRGPVIDLARPPKLPFGSWRLISHRGERKVEYKQNRLCALWRHSEANTNLSAEEFLQWFEERQERTGTHGNMNLWQFLKDNPKLVSRDWDDKTVVFWM
jgi:uncharacterized protein YecA (UPF0149 family)